jgi:hypothetical protein
MAISFLSANAVATSTFTGTCTVPIAISRNDTVIVAVKYDPNAFLLGPTDDGGTLYTSLGGFSNGSVNIGLFASPPNGALASTFVSCSISPAFTDVMVLVARYSGVGAFGNSVISGGVTANPSITLGTSAANSFIIAAFANDSGQADTPLTGNLRQTLFFAGTTNDTASLVDSTSPSPALLNTAVTNIASNWVAVAVEMLAAGPITEDSWLPSAPVPPDPNISVW